MTQQEMDELRYLVHWYHRNTLRQSFAEKKASGCVGKHGFDTHNQARSTISPRLAKWSHTYLCKVCGKWHIGGMRAMRDQRLGYQVKKQRGASQ